MTIRLILWCNSNAFDFAERLVLERSAKVTNAHSNEQHEEKCSQPKLKGNGIARITGSVRWTFLSRSLSLALCSVLQRAGKKSQTIQEKLTTNRKKSPTSQQNSTTEASSSRLSDGFFWTNAARLLPTSIMQIGFSQFALLPSTFASIPCFGIMFPPFHSVYLRS